MAGPADNRSRSAAGPATGSVEPPPVGPPPGALGQRDVVVVRGADARTYLHSQLSQDIAAMDVGAQRWSFVLEPNGKVAGFARVTRSAEDTFELDTDAGYGDLLEQRLRRFMIRVDVAIERRTEPGERDDAVRVAAGWPALGAELWPGETIPGATGLAGIAISFTKGCYPGQELVERMDSRAADAPRTLRRLVVAEGARPGDPVVADDGSEVGTLTSVANTNALGWVRRGVELGEPVAHS